MNWLHWSPEMHPIFFVGQVVFFFKIKKSPDNWQLKKVGSGNPHQKMPNQLRRFFEKLGRLELRIFHSFKFLNQPNPSSTSSGLIIPHVSIWFVQDQPRESWWNTDDDFLSMKAQHEGNHPRVPGCPRYCDTSVFLFTVWLVDRSERDAIEKKFKEDPIKRSVHWTLDHWECFSTYKGCKKRKTEFTYMQIDNII